MSKTDSIHVIRPTASDHDFDCEEAASQWYVLLWSQSQNGFHIERHRHMLDANRRAYADDRSMDYVPIIVGTHEFCCRMADKLRPTVRAREDARQAAQQAIDGARRTAAREGESPRFGGLEAAMVKLSSALGHPHPVYAAEGQCVEARLIEMAAEWLIASERRP